MSNEVNKLRAAIIEYVNTLPREQLQAVYDYTKSCVLQTIHEVSDAIEKLEKHSASIPPVSLRCLVICRDANGVPCLIPVIVQASEREIADALHYDAAVKFAKEALKYGDAIGCIDERDGNQGMSSQLFKNEANWKDAEVIDCSDWL